ncbi:MAG: DNA translocase FtsK [Verrucomicrobiae bacterium]|nr:DNA translocase FtsK [Verrucomicrobiae bacterium]
MAKKDTSAIPRDLAGIVAICGSILLACALFSYDARDVALLHSPPTSVNWMGVMGAWTGFALYQFIGWSANLLPLILAYLGIAALWRGYRFREGAIWAGAFLCSMACLVQLGWHGANWTKANNNFFGIGGAVGLYVGKKVFWSLLKHGAIIIFALGSAACAWFTLQLRPADLVGWIREGLEAWKQFRRSEVIRKGDLGEAIDARIDDLEERRKRLRDMEKEMADRIMGAPQRSESSLRRSSETKSRRAESEAKQDPAARRGSEEAPPPSAPPSTPPSAAPEVPPSETPPPTAAEPRAAKAKPKRPKLSPPRPTSLGAYHLPPLEILKHTSEELFAADSKELVAQRGALIIQTLKDFDIDAQMGDITQGATITRFEIVPSPGVRVERIVNLQNNLTLVLRADRVNILAPVAGRGTVGIEVGNASKSFVTVRELIESEEFRSSKARIPLALGKDVYGKTLIGDLAEMPHLLIAGSTGAGKSVCINAILTSLIYRFTPDDLRLLLVDPKVVELQVYNDLPHLIGPVVSDPKKVVTVLKWALREMDRRYKIIARAGVRNIWAYNARPKPKKEPEPPPPKEEDAPGAPPEEEDSGQGELFPKEELPMPDQLPYLVIIVDELADLMQTAPVEVEDAITRITQKARAAGIHIVVATQTPRAQVVTGTIKANLPSKIAFRVGSKVDSRVILDENGAENLLGKGDMMFKSFDSATLRRAQGAFVSDDEVRLAVEHCAKQAPPSWDEEVSGHVTGTAPLETEEEASEEDVELLQKCIEVIRQERRASVSLLQRRLRLGYTRAARIMDLLEQRGVVGPGQGAKDREILLRLDNLPPQPPVAPTE